MDTAIMDPLICNNSNKLQAINHCRLFHGLYCISDMKLYDGSGINKGLLRNTTQRRLTITQQKKWPNVSIPTPWQWQVWQDFIWRHWIKGDGTSMQFNPSLHSRCTQVIQLRMSIHQHHVRRYSTLNQSIQHLPPSLRYLAGNVYHNVDTHAQICDMVYVQSLNGAADGSVHQTDPPDGSFGYIVLLQGSNTNLIYGGVNSSLGHILPPNEQNIMQ